MAVALVMPCEVGRRLPSVIVNAQPGIGAAMPPPLTLSHCLPMWLQPPASCPCPYLQLQPSCPCPRLQPTASYPYPTLVCALPWPLQRAHCQGLHLCRARRAAGGGGQ